MCFMLPRIQLNIKVKDVGNDYVFREDGFSAVTVSENFSGRDDMKYILIIKVFETEKYFFIYINKRQMFVVDKATVEGGTAWDIREKLSRVPGGKYVRCKYQKKREKYYKNLLTKGMFCDNISAQQSRAVCVLTLRIRFL